MVKKIFFALGLFFISCEEDNRIKKEIAEIPVEVKIERFDVRWSRATSDSLPSLKEEFPYLFPKQYQDRIWTEKLKDTIQQELNIEVEKAFSHFSQTESELNALFQHISYYFPSTTLPKVVTLTSEVDYRNKVIWSDSLLLISLDTYLGKEHHFYQGIQEYIRKNMKPDQITPDVVAAFSETKISRPSERIFLAHMIYYGKILYLKDLLIPDATDFQKIGYTEEELEWAKSNEEQIWRYFIDKELLFARDSQLYTRFLYPAPFSKFYLELDNETPARLGQFIGWQIVRRFMDRTNSSVNELIEMEAETIFKKSNYKPEK